MGFISKIKAVQEEQQARALEKTKINRDKYFSEGVEIIDSPLYKDKNISKMDLITHVQTTVSKINPLATVLLTRPFRQSNRNVIIVTDGLNITIGSKFFTEPMEVVIAEVLKTVCAIQLGHYVSRPATLPDENYKILSSFVLREIYTRVLNTLLLTTPLSVGVFPSGMKFTEGTIKKCFNPTTNNKSIDWQDILSAKIHADVESVLAPFYQKQYKPEINQKLEFKVKGVNDSITIVIPANLVQSYKNVKERLDSLNEKQQKMTDLKNKHVQEKYLAKKHKEQLAEQKLAKSLANKESLQKLSQETLADANIVLDSQPSSTVESTPESQSQPSPTVSPKPTPEPQPTSQNPAIAYDTDSASTSITSDSLSSTPTDLESQQSIESTEPTGSPKKSLKNLKDAFNKKSCGQSTGETLESELSDDNYVWDEDDTDDLNSSINTQLPYQQVQGFGAPTPSQTPNSFTDSPANPLTQSSEQDDIDSVMEDLYSLLEENYPDIDLTDFENFIKEERSKNGRNQDMNSLLSNYLQSAGVNVSGMGESEGLSLEDILQNHADSNNGFGGGFGGNGSSQSSPNSVEPPAKEQDDGMLKEFQNKGEIGNVSQSNMSGDYTSQGALDANGNYIPPEYTQNGEAFDSSQLVNDMNDELQDPEAYSNNSQGGQGGQGNQSNQNGSTGNGSSANNPNKILPRFGDVFLESVGGDENAAYQMLSDVCNNLPGEIIAKFNERVTNKGLQTASEFINEYRSMLKKNPLLQATTLDIIRDLYGNSKEGLAMLNKMTNFASSTVNDLDALTLNSLTNEVAASITPTEVDAWNAAIETFGYSNYAYALQGLLENNILSPKSKNRVLGIIDGTLERDRAPHRKEQEENQNNQNQNGQNANSQNMGNQNNSSSGTHGQSSGQGGQNDNSSQSSSDQSQSQNSNSQDINSLNEAAKQSLQQQVNESLANQQNAQSSQSTEQECVMTREEAEQIASDAAETFDEYTESYRTGSELASLAEDANSELDAQSPTDNDSDLNADSDEYTLSEEELEAEYLRQLEELKEDIAETEELVNRDFDSLNSDFAEYHSQFQSMNSAMTEKDLQSLLSEMKQSSMRRDQSADGFPSLLDRQFADFFKVNTVWYRSVENMITRWLPTKQYSYRRPNKRYLHTGTILQSASGMDFKNSIETLHLYLDSSGSMTDKDFAILCSIIKKLGPKFPKGANSVKAYEFNNILAELPFKNGQLLKKPKSTGGTEIEPVLANMKKQKRGKVLNMVITDGGIGHYGWMKVQKYLETYPQDKLVMVLTDGAAYYEEYIESNLGISKQRLLIIPIENADILGIDENLTADAVQGF